MAKYRRRIPPIEVAYYDGRLVGEFDHVTGLVVPGTCPTWFPAVIPEVEPGDWKPPHGRAVQVGDVILLGQQYTLPLEIRPGHYVLHFTDDRFEVVDAATLERDFEVVR